MNAPPQCEEIYTNGIGAVIKDQPNNYMNIFVINNFYMNKLCRYC